MPFPLATLDDLKAELSFTHTQNDAALSGLLLDATALAEQLAGRPLRRVENSVEYPTSPSGRRGDLSRYIFLRLAPVESIASIVQKYGTTTDAEFDAAVAGGADAGLGLLAEPSDYVTEDAGMGRLVRVDLCWAFGPRWLRVVSTAGYHDPSLTAGLDGLPAEAFPPPGGLQRAIVQQAAAWWTHRGKPGFTGLSGGGPGAGGSSVDAKLVADALPLLKRAAHALRRPTL